MALQWDVRGSDTTSMTTNSCGFLTEQEEQEEEAVSIVTAEEPAEDPHTREEQAFVNKVNITIESSRGTSCKSKTRDGGNELCVEWEICKA